MRHTYFGHVWHYSAFYPAAYARRYAVAYHSVLPFCVVGPVVGRGGGLNAQDLPYLRQGILDAGLFEFAVYRLGLVFVLVL